MPSAIVVGATGILGREIVFQLGKSPEKWQTIYALSRSKKGDFPANVRHNFIDLTSSASQMAQHLNGMTAEYVFFAAWLQQDTEQANWDVNGDMLQNFLDALDATGAASSLKRIVLVTGCKQYGVHLGPPKNPMLETDPWLRDPASFPPNFYYRQQDILHAFCDTQRAKGGQVAWTVTYPNDVIGFARGNFMNLTTSLGIYVAVEKELGRDLVFPGSERFYSGFDAFTDAGLHARFCEWAAFEPRAAGEAFNVVNGDVESWQNLWPRVAERFGMKVKPDQFVAGYGTESRSSPLGDVPPVSVFAEKAGLQGRVERGRLEQNVDLSKWTQREDVRKAWDALATREGLDKKAFEEATWDFLAFVLGRAFDMVISMNKARAMGWTGHKDTWTAMSDVFDKLEEAKVLPKTR